MPQPPWSENLNFWQINVKYNRLQTSTVSQPQKITELPINVESVTYNFSDSNYLFVYSSETVIHISTLYTYTSHNCMTPSTLQSTSVGGCKLVWMSFYIKLINLFVSITFFTFSKGCVSLSPNMVWDSEFTTDHKWCQYNSQEHL